MKPTITYNLEKFFTAVRTIESIPQERATMREQIASIIELVTSEKPISSGDMENISYDDIEKAEEEMEKINLDCPLDSPENKDNIIVDMVFVEHAKDNLRAISPNKNANRRNLF